MTVLPDEKKKALTILLIQLGDIGDVVLTFPAMKALRDHFPHAEIMVAVREKAKDILEDCPCIDGVIAIVQQKRSLKNEIAYQWNFFSDLRKHRFDIAIDMRTGTRGAILALLSGACQRIGFYADDGRLWRNRLFTHLKLKNCQPGLYQYMAEYYSGILTLLDIHVQKNVPDIYVSDEKIQTIRTLLLAENIPDQKPFLVFQPFSLWQYKEWGNKKYIELIKSIVSDYGLPVVIVGTQAEKSRAQDIVGQCGSGVYNLAGKTSLSMLAALLKVSGLFIGADSAGIHIAAAVGTPTIGIFGPSPSALWAPKGENHSVIHKNFSCVPCRDKGCGNTEKSLCLEELSVSEVLSVIKPQIEKILNNKGKTCSRIY